MEFSQYDRLSTTWASVIVAYCTFVIFLTLKSICYYAAADIVVLPYREVYQSGVVLMAMSYGRPVLVRTCRE